MTLELVDFVTETEGVDLEDFPPEVQDRINGALGDLTGNEGGPGNEPVEPPQSIIVDAGGDGDYESIQNAISNDEGATSGDVIFVEPGEYDESVTVDVEDLTLEGPNAGIAGDSDQRGAEATITSGVFFDNQDDVTVDGFTIERTVVSGEGVVQLGSGGPARIGENAVIKNNVINAVPSGERKMAGVLFEGDLEDELFVENNLITQEDGTPVQAVTNFESEIGTLEITDNTIDTGSAVSLGGESSDITATISGNEFTDSFEARPAVVIYNSDELDLSINDNTFDGVVAGVRTSSSISTPPDPNVSVSITNNDFIGDNTAWYVEDNLDVLDLGAVLNDQDNTFDPTGGVDDNQIVVQQ